MVTAIYTTKILHPRYLEMDHSYLESKNTVSQVFRATTFCVTAILSPKIVGHSYLEPNKMRYTYLESKKMVQSYLELENTGSQLFIAEKCESQLFSVLKHLVTIIWSHHKLSNNNLEIENAGHSYLESENT